MNALQQILTTIALSSFLSHADDITNTAIPIVGKHSGKNLKELGIPFYNKIDTKPSSLIDGDTQTAVNTWKGRDLESHSYFGVLWPTSKVTDVTSVTVSMAIYKDGGWFGRNKFLPLNKMLMINQSLTEISQPLLQVTDDLGKSWRTVKAHSDYLEKMNRQTLPQKSLRVINDIVFKVNEPLININGIRVIGTDGGRTPSDSNGFVALAEFKVKGKQSEGSAPNAIMGLHSGKDLASMGLLYHNDINNSFNIIDKDSTTSCDTWNFESKDKYSFAGIISSKLNLSDTKQLKVTFNTYLDGGWFGVNSSCPSPSSPLTKEQITEESVPLLQVTTDKGKSWETVKHQTNYLVKMLGHKIGDNADATTIDVTFTPELPFAENINGIRLIGTEGGAHPEKDKNGFISIAEIELLKTKSEEVSLSGVKCDFNGQELSWEVEKEGWIKEFRVINRDTNETILITPAVDADVYCIDIAEGIKPELQIVDIYGKSHDIILSKR